MLELFQITGSASFATRAALEEGGIPYVTRDVHPKRRAETPDFETVNPLMLVASIRNGDDHVYETGANLLYLVETFPEANLGPQPGEPGRADLLRWVVWCSNNLHTIWYPLLYAGYMMDGEGDPTPVQRKARTKLEAAGRYLENQLTGRDYCLGERFSVADIYVYMIKGWESYAGDGTTLGGPAVQAHYERVGARPAIVRTRELDDLDERLQRYHPELRAGQPI